MPDQIDCPPAPMPRVGIAFRLLCLPSRLLGGVRRGQSDLWSMRFGIKRACAVPPASARRQPAFPVLSAFDCSNLLRVLITGLCPQDLHRVRIVSDGALIYEMDSVTSAHFRLVTAGELILAISAISGMRGLSIDLSHHQRTGASAARLEMMVLSPNRRSLRSVRVKGEVTPPSNHRASVGRIVGAT